MAMTDSSKLILLVEDDPDHEALTIRALKKSNMVNDVRVARDGEEAIELLCGPNPIKPQVILLDLKLPKLDGLEVFEVKLGDPFLMSSQFHEVEEALAVLRQLRMRHAAALLKANHLTIDQVSHGAGYASRSSFFRAFRKAYGRDPSDYRSNPDVSQDQFETREGGEQER